MVRCLAAAASGFLPCRLGLHLFFTCSCSFSLNPLWSLPSQALKPFKVVRLAPALGRLGFLPIIWIPATPQVMADSQTYSRFLILSRTPSLFLRTLKHMRLLQKAGFPKSSLPEIQRRFLQGFPRRVESHLQTKPSPQVVGSGVGLRIAIDKMGVTVCSDSDFLVGFS